MAQTDTRQLNKSVSFFGLVALGLGGVWGTSWLVVSSAWMSQGGGVVTVLLAWLLIAVVELPLVLAYKRAVPMFPKAEGEMSYSQAAFGKAAGFWAAWFGILVNLIVCAYEVCALVRMVNFLWSSAMNAPWYTVKGSGVNGLALLLGIALVLGITTLHYRGIRISSTFTKIITTTIMVLTAVGVILAFSMGSFSNYKPIHDKPILSGMIAVAAMLPFSLAGWESIAKGAEEAEQSKSSGKAVPVAWTAGLLAYVLTMVATGMVMPWKDGAKDDIPFATGLNDLAGSKAAGDLLIITAIIGVVGVYNALFYSLTRQMFGMARQGMLPRWLADVHGKHNTPYKAIIFATVILLVAPFLGKSFLLSYVDAASFAYIILWGSTFLSIVVLRRRYKNTAKAFSRPGGIGMELLGYASILFMLGIMLLPNSPGRLIWPTEHIILGALIVIGAALYFLNERSKRRTFDADLRASGEHRPLTGPAGSRN